MWLSVEIVVKIDFYVLVFCEIFYFVVWEYWVYVYNFVWFYKKDGLFKDEGEFDF